ncbi:MAG: ABC transporter ATP-binding protein [Eggerthellaceae bacterium]|nr:ABC transporter ATP-binding protein [Eggerthellaceae bacterium]
MLKAEGLSKQFFRKGRESARYFDAVSSCDLEISSGEVVVLSGRSGSGKSTLLNMLAGLLMPTEGSVELDGRSLYELDDKALSSLRNASFGVIPQGQTAVHSLSVIENVKLPYELYRTDDAAEEKAMTLLEEMGIANLADSFSSELSGGELRRMAIARALMCDPAYVFADEPTADLDDENTAIVLDLLKHVAESGTSVFLVTHESGAARIADRILRMEAGNLTSA